MNYIERTLIVEDSQGIRDLLLRYFQIFNLGRDLAEDGRVALRKIDENADNGLSYRVIFTDLEMPNIDGLDMIRQIEERVNSGRILKPGIYVLTGGHKNIGEVYSLIERGIVSRIFNKPEGISEAVRRIKDFYDSLRVQ